ncbi:MAG TPA: hypothetical protein VI564_08785 [Candidatus Nanoarchaeia archaeon]|nr:hypothetical protein [Candidatus Nanoarchaeia archaeon]
MPKLRKILLIALTLGVLFFQIGQIDWNSAYRSDWDVCLDYVKQGTLFSGQPHCASGIVLFYTAFIFKSIFGSFYQTALRVFVLAVLAIVIYLIYRIAKIESGKDDFWFILLVSLLLLFPQSNTTNLEKIWSMQYLLIGFYFLYYSRLKFSWAFSGIFFAAAIFSSMQSVIILAILAFYYPFHSEAIKIVLGEKAKMSISPKKFYPLLKAIALILLVFVIIWIRYPKILDYSLLAHSTDPLYGFFEAAVHLLPSKYLDSRLFVLYIAILFSAYEFFKGKKVFALAGGLGLLTIFYVIHKGPGGMGFGKYTFPAIPFFIITLALAKSRLKKHGYKNAFFYAILFFVLVFPSIEEHKVSTLLYDDLAITLKDFQKEVGYGIHFIPKQDKNILLDSANLLLDYDYQADPSKITVAGDTIEQPTIDEWSGPRLQKLGITDLSKWKPSAEVAAATAQKQEEEINKIRSEIEEGKYSLILYGPRGSSTMIAQAMMRLNSSVTAKYCTIVFPNLEHTPQTGMHIAYALMSKSQDCQQTAQKMFGYYNNAFEHICKKSRFAANNVVAFVFGNFYGVNMGKTCQKGGNFIENFNHHPLFPHHWMLVLGVVILSLIASLYYAHKDETATNNFKKWCCIIIAVLVIIFIYLFITAKSDLGYFMNFA